MSNNPSFSLPELNTTIEVLPDNSIAITVKVLFSEQTEIIPAARVKQLLPWLTDHIKYTSINAPKGIPQ